MLGLTQDYLDALIAGQRRAARWYTMASVATVALGLLVVALALLLGSRISGESLQLGLSIGGGFIATAAAFPAKEIVAIRVRIDLYMRFRSTLIQCSPDEADRIQTIVWEAIGKVASV